MGNLIIKGIGGAGNKLILQDQAGAAVLTTADSGATIASGVTGGAGLSGMTSLGTVTAGNLSNSAIVYPAGHIINVWSNYYDGNGSHVITNTGGQSSNPDSLTNTLSSARVYSKLVSVTVNVASGNDLIVQYTGGQHDSQTQGQVSGYGYVIKVPDSSANNRGYEFTRYPHYPANLADRREAQYGFDISGSILVGEESGDTIATGNIEVSIYGFVYSEGSTTQTFNIGKTTMIAMEVQR